MINTTDPVYMLNASITLNEKKLSELLSSLNTLLIPRKVDGKVVFEATPAFDAALEKEQLIRKGIEASIERLRAVELLLDEANEIHPLPERSLSGIMQAAMYFGNKNAQAAMDAKIEIEMRLNRGIPCREEMESYTAIIEESSPVVKENLKQAEKLRVLANKVRALCV